MNSSLSLIVVAKYEKIILWHNYIKLYWGAISARAFVCIDIRCVCLFVTKQLCMHILQFFSLKHLLLVWTIRIHIRTYTRYCVAKNFVWDSNYQWTIKNTIFCKKSTFFVTLYSFNVSHLPYSHLILPSPFLCQFNNNALIDCAKHGTR